MAVSNPPKLSSIIAEFGTSGSPKNLNAYRRDGGLVFYNNVGNNSGGSRVRLSQFAGLQRPIGVRGVNTVLTSDKSGPIYGFSYSGGYGSESSAYGVLPYYSGALRSLQWHSLGSISFEFLGNIPNAGWTRLEINGKSWYRTSASNYTVYNTGGEDRSVWSWNETTNPFSTGNFYYAQFI